MSRIISEGRFYFNLVTVQQVPKYICLHGTPLLSSKHIAQVKIARLKLATLALYGELLKQFRRERDFSQYAFH